MSKNNFAHLHLHTDYSLLDGAIQIKPLAERLRELGMTACAMTDHGNMYGAVSFYKEMKAHDIKPLIGCCLPGQLIFTGRGVKPIEEVQVGDLVFTHRGRFQPVVRAMTRSYRGDIYGLKAGNSQTVWLTNEHPVLTVGGLGQASRWVRADEIQGGLRSRHAGVNSWKTYVAFPRLPQTGLGQSEELHLCNYLDQSIYEAQGGVVHKVSKYNKWDRTIAFDIPARIPVTPDLCRLLGLFVAEGSFARDSHGRATSLVFTFHRDEVELAEFVETALQKTFKQHTWQTIRDDKTIREVHCSSTVIARLFEDLCGSGCAAKRIPEFVYQSSRQNIGAFVGGVVDGDGRRATTGQVTIRMTSREVVYGLRLLVASLGYAGVARECKGNKRPVYMLTWSERPAYRRYIQDEGYLYFPLKTVSTRFYEGPVFNLEVAEDHSYVTDFALHNCEMYLAPGSRFDKKDIQKGVKPYNHMILLAKDRVGYHNLVRLTSKAFTEGFYRKPRIDRELLAQFSDGIIGLSACLSGVPQDHLKHGRLDAAEKSAHEFQDILGRGNYFLEIQDHELPEQQQINKNLIALSKKTGIPLVATNDAHYLFRDDYEAHDVMLCIGTGKTVNDANRMRFGGPQWYVRSPEEMSQIFHYIPDAVVRTMEVAEMCDLKLPLGENQLPIFPIPAAEGDITIDEYFEKVIRQGYEKRREMVWEPMRGKGTLRHGMDEYQQRVSSEIAMIKQMGFPSYFLIVWDFIKFAKDRKIPVGPGRGSAAGSLIAYCLEITDVDPIQYDLLFERFLNPERVSMPDIDIDFCVHGRAEVINHVSELYGRESVCQIITFGTMASKAAIKDVGRALDMPYADVEKIAKLIPPPVRGRNISIGQALEMVPELKGAVDKDPQTKKVIEIALRLEGCARHSSVHAAGVVISPQPLDELIPTAVSQKQELTTQFEMSDLEKTGMLKMDFLGLTTLSIINQCCKTIKEKHDQDINWSEIPLDDEKTYKLFAMGHTEAVFQFESQGMQEICRKLKPKSIEDLSALNALYRPGPLDGGMVDDYIDRYHGRKPIEYLTPEMEGILGNTYGVCVTGDTLVFDADTGERVRIDELETRAGRLHVQGVDEDLRPRRARMTRWIPNGLREVVEMRLRNGSRVRLTPDHKVLTENGWQEIGQLRAGACVATPRRLFVAEEKEYDRDKLRALAYLLADGSLSSAACTADFVSKDAALIQEYQACVRRGFDRVTTRTLEQVRGVTRVMTKGVDKLSYHEPNALVRLLRELNLKSMRGGCRSEEKFVPEFIFGLTRESIAFFLASLWDCDGHVGARLCHYKTISPRLAQDVQTLLLRLGIHSTVYESSYYSNRRKRNTAAYQVTVYNLKAFAEWIAPRLVAKTMRRTGLSGEETCDAVSRPILLEELAQVWPGSARTLMRECGVDRQHFLPKGQRRPRINVVAAGKLAGHLSLPRTARNLNVRWEEIAEIKPVGVEQVYDITVEGIHNFVGNNIILHNCVYQEQIMQLAQRLGGYSLGEADLMRRAMGKKNREEMAVHEQKFMDGCIKNKIAKKKAKEIFRLMAQFADYGFNRCLTGDAGVVNADTGEQVSIRDIAEGRADVSRTFSFDGERMFANEITEAFETGEKEVVEIETEDGQIIRCTLDHKFYTDEGYLPLREIVEKGLEIFFSPEVEEYATCGMEQTAHA